MTNMPFERVEQLRDIESLSLLKEAEKAGRTAWAWNGIRKKGRDNARTPMQWDGHGQRRFHRRSAVDRGKSQLSRHQRGRRHGG